MSVSLSTADLDRLEAATRVLLSPLVAPDPVAWRREVLRATRELMQADHAMFTLSNAPRPLLAESDVDPVVEAYADYLAIEPDLLETTDPVSSLWLRHHRANGLGAFIHADIEGLLGRFGYTMRDSGAARATLLDVRHHDIHGMLASAGGAEAAIQLTNLQAGRATAGEDARPLLRALVPSFRAGLDALHTFEAHRATLDAVAEPLVVLTADGRERHRNPALVALLDADPERTAVEHALWQMSGDLRRLAFPRRFEPRPAAAPMRRVVQTARAAYALSAALLPSGAFGPGEASLVRVEARLAPRPLSPAEVMARTGLSAREAEVALLVSEGLSNAAIAERLFVATGTVKRHVENVLAKLDLASRAAVAGRLAAP